MISFENVSKQFIVRRDRRNSLHEWVTGIFKPRLPAEDFWALRDVSFSVGRGETVGLIGHNGSGKSTTLKLITQILQPTHGRVVVDGRISALLELGSGFHPDLTGRENIYLNGSLLGFTRHEMDKKVKGIINFSEMEEFIDMPVKHYSSGMYMRLGFAVAINVDPDILITDEVLAVGDEAFQRKCMDRIYALKKRGKTILFVSHAMGQVRDLCDRALWFHHGELMTDDNPGKAIDAYLAETNIRDAARIEAEHAEQAAESAAQAAEEAAAQGADAAEAPEQAEAAVAESKPVDPLRWGSREVEITDVEFINPAGKAAHTANTGESLTIRIHYVAYNPIEQPVFGIAIHHRTGFHVNGPNSRFGGLDIPLISGRGYVDYRIPVLPLLEGDYEVTAAIYDQAMLHPFDHHYHKWSFRVYSTSIAERFGAIYIPAVWDWAEQAGAAAPASGARNRQEVAESPAAQ